MFFKIFINKKSKSSQKILLKKENIKVKKKNNMSSYIFYCDSESEDENFSINRRYIRDKSNPLDLPDTMFVLYFRVSKDAFKFLLNIIESKMKVTTRSSSILPIIKLCAVLRFFGEGCYQVGAGNDFNVGVAQSTFSIILKEILNIFETYLCPELIKFPETVEEKMRIKEHFYRQFRFPGIIGCVDGTHIKIFSPPKREKHFFINRKGFFSLNAMLVCDHEMKITYIDTKYPGSCHDSFIFNSSSLDIHLQNNYNNGERNTWLLGDAGYPLKPYLMTPYRSTTEHSEIFNDIHCKARNIVERTIGVLKNRFRCILGERQLHYDVKKCKQIVNVCCALHNLCIKYNVPNIDLLDETSDDLLNDIDNQNDEQEPTVNSAALSIRDSIRDSLREH